MVRATYTSSPFLTIKVNKHLTSVFDKDEPNLTFRVMLCNFIRFDKNPSISFWVMLVTNEPTDKHNENITFQKSNCIGDDIEAGIVDSNKKKKTEFFNNEALCEY